MSQLTSTRLTRPAWQEAYDAQMALWRWYRTERGLRWLKGLYQTQAGEEQLTDKMRAQLSSLFDAEEGKMLDLDPIYVSADMTELVDAARHDFKPEPLLMTDLMTPRAFLYYAKPITIVSKNGEDLVIRAFSWAQQYKVADGVAPEVVAKRMLDPEMLAAHGERLHLSETDAMIAEGLMDASGVAITLYADRQHYVDLIISGRGANPKLVHDQTAGLPLVPIHLAPWWYGMEFAGNEIDLEGNPTGAEGWWRMAQTTLRLMQQKLAHKGMGRPHRATRREAARLGFPHESEVVIVRLRRESADPDPDHEPGEANYSHRFIVGGHWRNQWYPSEKLHRQIYIAPYVKGPEDKPLIVRPRRVFQWQR